MLRTVFLRRRKRRTSISVIPKGIFYFKKEEGLQSTNSINSIIFGLRTNSLKD